MRTLRTSFHNKKFSEKYLNISEKVSLYNNLFYEFHIWKLSYIYYKLAIMITTEIEQKYKKLFAVSLSFGIVNALGVIAMIVLFQIK